MSNRQNTPLTLSGAAERRRRRISAGLLVLACIALAGCGFHPLYSESDDGEFDAQLASVSITPISERIGQIVANSLRDGFNPTGARVPKRFVLTVVLATSTGDYAIRKDGTASRELFAVNGSFNMFKVGDELPVLTGSVRINDSYDVGESQYSVIVANGDAQKRAAREISADIRTRVSLYFRREAKS